MSRYRLQLLGGAVVHGENGVVGGGAAQRRPLALLSLLAVAGETGLSRDKILGYLWPDAEEDRARRALSQLVYSIRKELGEAVIASGPVLRINPEVLHSDVGVFDAAVREGVLDRAVRAWGGRFLDGFFVSGAPEFDRWAEEQRARYDRAYHGALETLATGAESRGEALTAVEWWRKLATAEPLSSRVAMRLMQALVQAGDHAGAIRHAEQHELLLHSELGASAPDEMVAMARSLSRNSQPKLTPRMVTVVPSTPARGNRAVTATRGSAVAGESSSEGRAEGAAGSVSPRRRVRVRRGAIALGLIVTTAAITWTAALLSRRDGTEAASNLDERTVAILPFAVTAREPYQYLGNGVVHMLSAALDGTGGLRTVDPNAVLNAARTPGALADSALPAAAARWHAGRIVQGSVVEAGDRLVLSATIRERDRAAGSPRTVRVEGAAAKPFELVDELGVQLLAALADQGGEGDRLVRVTARISPSLPALKEYLDGEAALREGRHSAALEHLLRATEIDSTFALAQYRLSLAADWANRGDIVRAAAARAARYASRLPPRDRMLLDALGARQALRLGEAEAGFRAVLASYPSDVEARFELADLIFHDRLHQLTDSRALFENVLAEDPRNLGAYIHLAAIAAHERDTVALDTIVARGVQLGQGEGVSELLALGAFGGGRADWKARVTRALAQAGDATAYAAAWRVASYAHDLASAEALLRPETLPPRSPDYRAEGLASVARIELAQGRYRDAMRDLALADRVEPGHTLRARGYWAAIPFVPTPPATIRALRAELTSADSTRIRRSSAWYLDGLLALRLGDTAAVLRDADRLAAMRPEPDLLGVERSYAEGLRALVDAAAGRDAAALRILTPEFIRVGGNASHQRELEVLARARALERTGQLREAERAYAALESGTADDIVFVPISYLKRSQLLARMGDRAGAERALKRFGEMWARADREVVAAVSSLP